MKKTKGLWIVAFLMFASNAMAQVTTGTISGMVKDTSGAALPGAQVTILNEGTGISRTVATDDGGRYSAPSLSLGNYQVTGSLKGFQTEVRTGIELTVGREAVVDLSLPVGATTQTVEVTGEAPLVESTTASLGSLVDENSIRSLPLNGRSWDQLALLQPGVVQTSPGTTSGAPFTAGTAEHYSVGGQRINMNSFLLDGTNINDWSNSTPGGAAGTNLGVDTILEFKIFTNSFKAEYGRVSGSVVSAVTRSGTNSFHGTAFEYIRNSSLDARNYFDTGSSPPPFRRNQFGAVLGGPIKKNKTFFFGGYEGLRQGLGTSLTAIVPTLQARQGILPTGTVPVNPVVAPYLNLWPAPNGRNFGDGTAQFLSAPNIITNENNFMVRVDHQLNQKTSIFGRYEFDQDSLNNPQSLPNLFITEATRRQYWTLQVNSILSPKTFNNFRFAYNRTRSAYDEIVSPDPGAAVDLIPGQPMGGIAIGAMGAAANILSPLGPLKGNGSTSWRYNLFEWGDDISHVNGKHTLKGGVDVQRMQDNELEGNAVTGSYTFSTFQTFLAAKPSNLQASAPLGVPNYDGLRQTMFAFYGQDDYAVNSRLTLNLGLRWEFTTDPTEAHGLSAILSSPAATAFVVSDKFFSVTKKNFEPRIGLAWDLDASGKTVLRAAGGIYHNDLLPYAYWIQIAMPPFFGTSSINNPSFPTGYQQLPTGAPSAVGNGTISLSIMAPFQKTPTDYQYNLSIQHQIFRNTVIEVEYAGNQGRHEVLAVETDNATPSTFLAPGIPFFPVGAPRLNTAWAGDRTNETIGDSHYDSGTARLRWQTSNGTVGQIFYTYSKAMDEGSNSGGAESTRAANVILDPYDPALDWGLAEFDSRNNFGFNFTYPVPFHTDSKVLGTVANGWVLDAIGTFSAGLPFEPRLSASVSRDLSPNFAERPELKPGFSSNPIHGVSAGCPGFPAGSPLGGARNYFDPCAFTLPPAGTYSNNLGRDSIIGPGMENVNLALEKVFKPREAINVTFRAEMFNVMNHANFGLPTVVALGATGAANPSAGLITNTITPSRQVQFALRVGF